MSGLTSPDAVQRNDLAAFVERVTRLDDAAVIRLRRRDDDLVAAWVNTGFDVLAVRVCAGSLGISELETVRASPEAPAEMDLLAATRRACDAPRGECREPPVSEAEHRRRARAFQGASECWPECGWHHEGCRASRPSRG